MGEGDGVGALEGSDNPKEASAGAIGVATTGMVSPGGDPSRSGQEPGET